MEQVFWFLLVGKILLTLAILYVHCSLVCRKSSFCWGFQDNKWPFVFIYLPVSLHIFLAAKLITFMRNFLFFCVLSFSGWLVLVWIWKPQMLLFSIYILVECGLLFISTYKFLSFKSFSNLNFHAAKDTE